MLPSSTPILPTPLRTLDQHLDSARLRTRGTRLKRRHRVLQAEPMGDQTFHVEDAALDETDGPRPGVGVAVLELEVDFLGAEAHEGDLHVGLAHADDEDFAAELDGVDLWESGLVVDIGDSAEFG